MGKLSLILILLTLTLDARALEVILNPYAGLKNEITAYDLSNTESEDSPCEYKDYEDSTLDEYSEEQIDAIPYIFRTYED